MACMKTRSTHLLAACVLFSGRNMNAINTGPCIVQAKGRSECFVIVYMFTGCCRYVWSGIIVLLGIGLNIYSKNRSKVDSWLHVQLIRVAALYSTRRMRVNYASSRQFQV